MRFGYLAFLAIYLVPILRLSYSKVGMWMCF
ncbi:Uncharacterised protein [Vibrio cholerae]|nr:Uncharacterised protein [Vibrio cholerae]